MSQSVWRRFETRQGVMGKWLPLVGLGLAVLAVGLAKDGRFLQENEIGGADQEDDGESDREELLARELIGNQVELLVNRSGVDVAGIKGGLGKGCWLVVFD